MLGVAAGRDKVTGRAAQIRLELEYVEYWRLKTDLAVLTQSAIAFSVET